MKLTVSDREAFVRAVMDDVPEVDYVKQGRKLAVEYALSLMPSTVRKLYNMHPEWVALHPLAHYKLATFMVPSATPGLRPDCKLTATLDELAAKSAAQTEARKALRVKLNAVIKGCTTLARAKALLPEFEKYLPKDRGPSGLTNLPVANVVNDLMQAGWPKGEPKVTE